jgi:hypothetical protein
VLKQFFRGENSMTFTMRLLLAVGIVLIGLVIFFLPLSAFFLAYIVLINPPWFRNFLQNLNQAGPSK